MTIVRNDLSAIRARRAAATQGQWIQAEHVGESRALVARDRPYRSLLGIRNDLAVMDSEADAAFVAAASVDVPALCDEVEALRAELEAVRQQGTVTP